MEAVREVEGEILPPEAQLPAIYGQDCVRVAVRPNPFVFGDVETIEVAPGVTLQSIVDMVIDPPEQRPFAGVWVEGQPVPWEWWPHVRAKPGKLVNVVAGVAGGGGGQGDKDPMRTVLTIAVMVAAAYVGGPAGVAFFNSQLLATAAAVATPVSGAMTIAARTPPALS